MDENTLEAILAVLTTVGVVVNAIVYLKVNQTHNLVNSQAALLRTATTGQARAEGVLEGLQIPATIPPESVK